jgi:hypothetical protein
VNVDYPSWVLTRLLNLFEEIESIAIVTGLDSRSGMNLARSRTLEQDALGLCAWLYSNGVAISAFLVDKLTRHVKMVFDDARLLRRSGRRKDSNWRQSRVQHKQSIVKTKPGIKTIFDLTEGYPVLALAVGSTWKGTVLRQACEARLAIGASRSTTSHYEDGEFMRKVHKLWEFVWVLALRLLYVLQVEPVDE